MKITTRYSRLVIAACAAIACMLLWSFAVVSSAQVVSGADPALTAPEFEAARVSSGAEENPGDFEPNDEMAQSKKITVGAEFYQRHYFEVLGDVDWVKFRAWANIKYTLETFDLSSKNDTYLWLYDENGGKLDEDDNGGDPSPASKIDDWTALANGTYFIRVAHPKLQGGEGFTYSLRVTSSDPCGDSYDDEPDDTDNIMDDATPISIGETQEHTFHGPCGGDVDWATFDAVTNTIYTIQTFNLSDGNDTVLQLYNAEREEVASDDDDSSALPASRIDWMVTTTNVGTYFVKVSPFNRSAGGCDLSYKLKVVTTTSPPAPPTPGDCVDAFEYDDDPGDAKPIVINGEAQERKIKGDADWIKFWAFAGSEYTIRTFDLESGNDTELYLYEIYHGGVNELRRNDDITTGNQASRIIWTAPENGTYFAKVNHHNPDIGACLAYSFEITNSLPGADDYEEDDTSEQAKLISVDSTPQHHKFHIPCACNHDYEEQPTLDDWVRFEAAGGVAYAIQTSNLGGGNDTQLELYESQGENVFLLDQNDDYAGDVPASRIIWEAPDDGEYLVRVLPFDPRIGDCDVSYELKVITWITAVDLQAAPDEAPANGELASTLIALVGNADGGSVADETVCFTTTLGELSDECVQTNESGVAQVDLTSTEIGTATVIASVDFVSDTVLVSFTPPSLTLTALPSEAPADGVEASTVTAGVKDYSGEPVSDTMVCFASTLGDLSDVCTQTDGSGEARVELTSTEIGTATVTATIGLISETVQVVFLPPGLLLTASPDEAPANGEALSTLTAKVTDGAGGSIPDVTVCFASTLGNLSDECVQTNASGEAQATLTSTVIGTATVTASRDLLSKIVLVYFTPPSLTLTASPTETWAGVGDGSTLTALVRDYNGGTVLGQMVCFTATMGNLSDECTQTNESGVAQVALTSNVTGTATVIATVGPISETVPVTFVRFEGYVYLPLILKTSTNNPPYTPHNPVPVPGARDQSLDVDLSWSGGDPDSGDTVTYDIYFGKTSPPPLVVENHPTTTYDPGTLSRGAYYWYIVARDSHGAEARGSQWDFTTTCLCNDNHEPDDNIDQCLGFNALGSGKSVDGYICKEHVDGGQEEDWYWFNLASLDDITVDLTVPDAANYDLALWTGEGWKWSENPNRGADEHIEWSAKATGRYYVRVVSLGDHDNCHPYVLKVTYK